MDFRDQFRKMSDDVTKMARDVADTSKKATARARIRRMINSCNSSLQSIHREIGSRYYVENRCEPEEQYAGLFEQAADLIAQIDTLKSELASLENASICPECGSKVTDAQKFCPECGCKPQKLLEKLPKRHSRQSVLHTRKQKQKLMKPLPQLFRQKKAILLMPRKQKKKHRIDF